ncbi:high affinity cAMP-specific and IBMX-insensitive 3',5'-cyclic phosphodiesterase 8A [Folsomia candida]|uniref:high affinity cAMP-specific and IBMX-insensitive 3',5'-cyclic phosphodiesterase 8A n=1 Tax=Folsomia candida TaxID=158441 RepID=UPI0016051718|nr:high affinity cAMP-specific and IBMX-insensitive 3',5'-cyclic phosphodiesterase 8A [Folsomia candida]
MAVMVKDYNQLVLKCKTLTNDNECLTRKLAQRGILVYSARKSFPPKRNKPGFIKRIWNSIFRWKKDKSNCNIMDSPSTTTNDRSTETQELLDNEQNWNIFDVLRLEELTHHRPLVSLGMKLFVKFDVGEQLQADQTTFRSWLTLIEANYHEENPYHNSTHATDVMHATAYFLSTETLQSSFKPLDKVICLLAAAVHDVDHPGRTNPFLINSESDMAILYNDVSVLESHHASFAFRLTRSDPKVDIFANLDRDSYKFVRQSLIDMVLATDMAKHFDHLAKFNEVFQKVLVKHGGGMSALSSTTTRHRNHPTSSSVSIPHQSTLITPENISLVKRIMIKCADVSNPTRPLKQSVEWSRRIAEEYFRQTEEETERGLPIVLPMFDRKTCSIAKSQIGFIDFFVRGMYHSWSAFLDIPELMENMKYNYNYWKYLDKEEIKEAVFLDSYTEGKSTHSTSRNTLVNSKSLSN